MPMLPMHVAWWYSMIPWSSVSLHSVFFFLHHSGGNFSGPIFSFAGFSSCLSSNLLLILSSDVFHVRCHHL